MSKDVSERLERQADLLFRNIAGWERNALRRIGRRVKSIGKLSHADLQAINNAALVKQDMKVIMQELSIITGQNAAAVQNIYSEMMEAQHKENEPLYDYRGKKFKTVSESRELQAIVRAYARTTAKSMVNLSMTKAKKIGSIDKNGKFVALDKNFKAILDKAVMSISTGTGDFNSEMRDVLKELGGSGLRFNYGGGVIRRVDSMVRANLLWGAKQASVEYNEMIGEELGCDGIEIDWHSNPRPEHEFMQGRQFSLHGRKRINGVTYESADRALAALQDYGCLHFKTPIILGISEPTYTKEQLAELNRKNTKQVEIDGIKKTGYGWKQTMRRLETEGRRTREQMEILKASGDHEGVRQLKYKASAIEEKYTQIANATGIKAQREKMAIVKSNASKQATPNTDVEYMSKSFRPKFDAGQVVTVGNEDVALKRVRNSQFELYAGTEATRRDKAVRMTERNLQDVSKMLPVEIDMPKVAVVDFEKCGFNADAIGGYDRKTGMMFLNRKYYTEQQILDFVQETEGYFANQTKHAPYLHEIGHRYYDESIKRLAKTKKIGYNESKSIIDSRIMEYVHRHNDSGAVVAKRVGGHAEIAYRDGNYGELIAECFSVYGDSDFSRGLIDILGR